jgi:hypothetical protein
MRIRSMILGASILPFLALPLAAQAPAAAPAPAKPDHVTAIKQSLAASTAALHQYQWIETTTVSIKGEVKSTTQDQCYYGADGKVQKVPIGAPAEPAKSPRGIRGAIAKDKKEEISDSMKEAVALVKQYVPPDAQRIEAAKAAGNLSVVPPDPAGNVQIVIKNYLKSGDSLAIAANAATDKIGGIAVASFTDSAKNAVGLKITYSAFPDGTVYPAQIDLEVKEENLNVTIQNSGYKKAGG